MSIKVAALDSESFSFWKNLFLMAIFFVITPITLGVSLFSLFTLNTGDEIKVSDVSQKGVRVYASLPREFPKVGGVVESADARPAIIKQYF